MLRLKALLFGLVPWRPGLDGLRETYGCLVLYLIEDIGVKP
jgi:hypothetical protein